MHLCLGLSWRIFLRIIPTVAAHGAAANAERSESYCRTTCLCVRQIFLQDVHVHGEHCFPWWPCTRVLHGQACKMLLWDCQPGLHGVWFMQALWRRAWQLSWELSFLCEIGRQVKCWQGCKDELMPTCHRLFACFDVQQEVVGRLTFGLYCNRRLSVLDIARLEWWFGAFLYC